MRTLTFVLLASGLGHSNATNEEDVCGIDPLSPTAKVPFIVGGEDAKVNEFPWITLLIIQGPKIPGGQLCGGSLISPRYILTAAHCVTFEGSTNKIPAVYFKVYLGEHNRKTDDETKVSTYGAYNIKTHEDYDPITVTNDIAVIALDKEVDYNRQMYPICLPEPDDTFEDQVATVAGWGDIDPVPGRFRLRLPDVLKKVNVTIIPQGGHRYCKRESKLCAGGEKGKDSCNGDSGGPMMCRFSDGEKFKLCGIVSYGTKYCGVGAPAVYTNVAKFVDWISKNTDKTCSEGRVCVPVSRCPKIQKDIDYINQANINPTVEFIITSQVNEQKCGIEGIGKEDKYCCLAPTSTPTPVREEEAKTCLTVGNINSGRPCVFPFKFEGKTYSKCTYHRTLDRTEDYPDYSQLTPFSTEDANLPWCSTKVNSDGNHVMGEFGLCGDKCPRYDKPGELIQTKEIG